MTTKWHTATNLPTPGLPLLLEMPDGRVIEGVRPNYISDRSQDPDYRDMKGNRLQGVVKWAIR